jgi:hypothetical protein
MNLMEGIGLLAVTFGAPYCFVKLRHEWKYGNNRAYREDVDRRAAWEALERFDNTHSMELSRREVLAVEQRRALILNLERLGVTLDDELYRYARQPGETFG